MAKRPQKTVPAKQSSSKTAWPSKQQKPSSATPATTPADVWPAVTSERITDAEATEAASPTEDTESQPKNRALALAGSVRAWLCEHAPTLLRSRAFAATYAVVALLILLGTTVVWAYLSATVQQSNADQTVNAYLFENNHTFQGANFPGQHSFLFKWPIFWLISLLGARSAAFTWVTVGVVLLTVGIFALFLYRIERRALYFGTLCLALASVLAVVPAQPYAGGLLPVNMAMITTRNLEYILYITAVALVVRATRLKSWRFAAGALLFGVLAASDKLFLAFGIGSALLACVWYGLVRCWSFVTLAVRWLLAGLIAFLVATGLLGVISGAGWTHIAAGSQVSPYGATHSVKDIGHGVVYGVAGFLTNLGIDPANDTRLLRTVPHQAAQTLLSWGVVALLVNSVLLVLGTYAVYRLVKANWRPYDAQNSSVAQRISLMMLWTTVVAAAVFVVSNHYYPVDARYLSIIVFALFLTGATFLRTVQIRREVLVSAGLLLCLGIASGLVVAHRSYNDERAAVAPLDKRNVLISQALSNHPVQVLMGDYWRVIPTKLAAHDTLQVMPLESCTTARSVLSSKAWQPNPEKVSFAYLLTFDQSLTGYPKCSLDTIINRFGKPNASIPIAGTTMHPQELLLFYDRGAHKSAPAAPTSKQNLATVAPISTDDLPYTSCNQPTVMVTVAHQDDDLLFMNPDVQHDIQAGRCIRTVYLTAGDAGSGPFYWIGREQGAEAAYATMLGTNTIWVQRLVKLADNQIITIANPRGNSKLSLIFMHLPDGNVDGSGFPTSHFESLTRLERGVIPRIHSIDGESTYTSESLTAALAELMTLYHPAEIRTQGDVVSRVAPDHSDHIATGRFTAAAYARYRQNQLAGLGEIPIVSYIGYPVRVLPPNISDGDLALKEKIFFVYAAHDDGVCRSMQECIRQSANYRAYLTREYYQ
ncbi:MAG TPA: PIG-L family deacetylase [Candidatus Saccharimonadales bacterium]|nr:PIG-L family deacetylase [Candidatus Saccharimonadales bacterium]